MVEGGDGGGQKGEGVGGWVVRATLGIELEATQGKSIQIKGKINPHSAHIHRPGPGCCEKNTIEEDKENATRYSEEECTGRDANGSPRSNHSSDKWKTMKTKRNETKEDVQPVLQTLKNLMRLNNRHPRKFKMKIMLFINMEVISVEY